MILEQAHLLMGFIFKLNPDNMITMTTMTTIFVFLTFDLTY